MTKTITCVLNSVRIKVETCKFSNILELNLLTMHWILIILMKIVGEIVEPKQWVSAWAIICINKFSVKYSKLQIIPIIQLINNDYSNYSMLLLNAPINILLIKLPRQTYFYGVCLYLNQFYFFLRPPGCRARCYIYGDRIKKIIALRIKSEKI